MKKSMALFLIIISTAILVGCSGTGGDVQDGTYRIESDTVDSRGYRDFIEFQFFDGQLISMTADAVEVKSGTFKSANEDIKLTMEEATGTYPEKYYKALVNQYIAEQNAAEVDIVSGATTSSKIFINLMKQAERAVRTNDFEKVVKIG